MTPATPPVKIWIGFQLSLPVRKCRNWWCKRCVNDCRALLLLAKAEARHVAYLKAEIKEREPFLRPVCNIAETYVVKGQRRTGIATKLCLEAEAWAKNKGIRWMTVSTHSLDQEAIRFWEKRGYAEFNKDLKKYV